eukprot:scaffold118035_cov63-Phaeocystis_antarctica.AAC.2
MCVYLAQHVAGTSSTASTNSKTARFWKPHAPSRPARAAFHPSHHPTWPPHRRRPGKRREGVRVDDGVVQRVPAQVSELLTAWVAGRGKTVVWAAPPGGSGAARPLLSSRAQRAPRAVGGQLRRCQDDELEHRGRAA